MRSTEIVASPSLILKYIYGGVPAFLLLAKFGHRTLHCAIPRLPSWHSSAPTERKRWTLRTWRLKPAPIGTEFIDQVPTIQEAEIEDTRRRHKGDHEGKHCVIHSYMHLDESDMA